MCLPLHNLTTHNSAFLTDVRMESFHIYKLLVLHDPDSNQRTGIFTKKALDADHVITIQKEWPLPGDDPQKQYRYNVFEFLTGKVCMVMLDVEIYHSKSKFMI